MVDYEKKKLLLLGSCVGLNHHATQPAVVSTNLA